MKKAILILMLMPFALFSQEEIFIKKNILRAHTTFSSGISTLPLSNIYFHSDLEYYLEENFSVKSDVFIYFGALGQSQLFTDNHAAFTGIQYHFKSSGPLNTFVGIQPGCGYTRLNRDDYPSFFPSDSIAPEQNFSYSFNPLISATAGLNYFASKYFHLFLQTRYVYGSHISNAPRNVSLSEFRVSFGLGFFIRTKKVN
jgi:hypothetical protein